MRATLLPIACSVLVCACDGDPKGAVKPAPAPYTRPSDDPCERVLGAPADDQRSAALAFSEAHALVRFFGHAPNYSSVDGALATALGKAKTADIPMALARYDEALETVCVTDAAPRALGNASVRVEEDVAWMTPGTGAVEVPSDVTTVVVDLRELPEVPELWDALDRAVAHALEKPIPRPRRVVRRYDGLPDDAYSVALAAIQGGKPSHANDVYSTSNESLRPGSISAAGKARRLLLLTGPRLAPSAAEMAGTLRLASRAYLLGHDVVSAVAESDSLAVGDRSVNVRVEDLFLWEDERRWPELVVADVHSDEPDAGVAAFLERGDPKTPPLTAATRAEHVTFDDLEDRQSADRNRATLRAALVTLHGTFRRFFPYFHLVGEELDPVFEEQLAAVSELPESVDDQPFQRALMRLSSALEDGHSWALDLGTDASRDSEFRYVPVAADVLDDGTPVVVASDVDGVEPGDLLVSRNGERMDEYLEAMRPLLSATNPLTKVLSTVSYWLLDTAEEVALEVEGLDGQVRRLDVATRTGDEYAPLQARRWARPSGWLTDLGADDVYYLNLDGASRDVLEPDANMSAQMEEVITAKARALVLDMRGYPGLGVEDALGRLRKEPMPSPEWWIERQTGPHVREKTMSQWSVYPGNDPVYEGPVVLLTGPGAQSAAETFAGLLTGAERVTVVGRTTSGTNGNITGIELPGRVGITFTGMEVRNVDGSDFHGIGIVPDIEVPRTQKAVAKGIDLDLAAALEHLATDAGE